MPAQPSLGISLKTLPESVKCCSLLKIMNLDERIHPLVDRFKSLENWEERYRYLIHLGRELDPLKEGFKVEENRVKGCTSQVWLIPEWREGRVVFQVDSDADIVKGLAALVIKIYSNATPEQILATRPWFVREMGLKQYLSLNRVNGLGSMLKQISLYALAYQAKKGESS